MKTRNRQSVHRILRRSIGAAAATLLGKWLRCVIATSAIAVLVGVAGNASANDDWSWLRASGDAIPLDAVVGGNEGGASLYVCRADYGNGSHPGKVRPGFGGCKIGWAGKEVTVPNYEVLIPTWVHASNGSIPPIASFLGNEAADAPDSFTGAPLYVCRARYNGGTHSGKIRPEFGGCNIGWGGKEVTVRDYDVLATPAVALDYLSPGGDAILAGALVGGSEGGTRLYVCRATYEHGIQLGKYRSGLGGCNIGWAGNEVTVPGYALVYPHWERSDAIVVGFAAGRDADASLLYICRGRYQGGVHPGKYRHEFGGCNITWGGKEITVATYEVLSRPPEPR